ncbi:MAG: hypothetical protein WAO15_26215, partial [Mycobacterium sp.]
MVSTATPSWSISLHTVILTGARRYLMRLSCPLALQLLKRLAAYRGSAGRYPDRWGAIRATGRAPS